MNEEDHAFETIGYSFRLIIKKKRHKPLNTFISSSLLPPFFTVFLSDQFPDVHIQSCRTPTTQDYDGKKHLKHKA
jgi:hypothetical protein